MTDTHTADEQPHVFHGEHLPKDIIATLDHGLDEAEATFNSNDEAFGDYTDEDKRVFAKSIARARLALSDLSTPWRRAKILNDFETADDLTRVERGLPANYVGPFYDEVNDYYYIDGKDNAGWTLDGYVIPRLASGLIFVEEVSW